MTTIRSNDNTVSIISKPAHNRQPKVMPDNGDSKPSKMISPVNAERKSKLQKLIEYLKTAGDLKFTGYLKINFTQGTIGRVERFEEILKK